MSHESTDHRRDGGVCVGRDAGDGRCRDCTLPMQNHPITFKVRPLRTEV